MTGIPFIQVDAFADAPFTGNPAAVMLMREWLPAATMQAIAAENNLSETAFLVPCADPGTADFDLRWFTPAVEVALCGHATLAAGHVVMEVVAGMDAVRFSTLRSGVLNVARVGQDYALALPALPAVADAARLPAVAAALGAPVSELQARGNDYLLAVLPDAASVRGLAPDFAAIRALAPGHDLMLIATAVGDRTDVISRVFVPGCGIDEDPVTGSAHAVLAPHWAARLGRNAFTAEQASARGGRLAVSYTGSGVVLAGRCRTVIRGEFQL
jgi:PhzF family phenazine biosynthesis protein